MNEVMSFLEENPVQYLATVGRDGAARCRPFLCAGTLDGRLWFCTNTTKEVYQDLCRNPWAEISVSSPACVWLRLRGRAVFEDNRPAKELCMSNPIVREQYGDASNLIFTVFCLAEAHAVLSDFSGAPPREYTL